MGEVTPTRRGFLRGLIYGAADAVAAPYVPVKTYSFLGSILRPSKPDVMATICEYNVDGVLVQQTQGRFVWQFEEQYYKNYKMLLEMAPEEVKSRWMAWPNIDHRWKVQFGVAPRSIDIPKRIPPLRERC